MQNAVFNVLAPIQSPEGQLENAVAQGNQQQVQNLVQEHQLDPSRVLTRNNETLLMVACSYGQAEMFKYLRSMYQWDIMAVHAPTGNTLLHLASRAGNLELVKLLIDEGLLASKRNAQRKNPYDLANDKVGHIKQFLLPHVFQGEQKDGTAPKLPHWLEETKSRGAPGFVPTYDGPPPPTTSAPAKPAHRSRPTTATSDKTAQPGVSSACQWPKLGCSMNQCFGGWCAVSTQPTRKPE